jgi:hypothetical protein
MLRIYDSIAVPDAWQEKTLNHKEFIVYAFFKREERLKVNKHNLFFLVLILALLFSLPVAAENQEVYWIAFIGIPQNIEKSGCSGLCIARSDGGEVRSLTEDVSFWSPLAWSSDGEWIAYVFHGDVYRISIDGQENDMLLDNFDLLNVIWQDIYPDGLEQLYELTPNTDLVTDIFWDEQGLLLRVSETPGFSGSTVNIYIFSIETGEIEQLTDFEEPWIPFYISLSPDNQYLVFAAFANCRYCNPPIRSGDIYILKTDGSQHIGYDDSLYSGRAAYPIWGRDGYIYFVKTQNDKELSVERISVVGKETEALIRNIPLSINATDTFTVTDHFFYLVAVQDNFRKVFIINRDTAQIQVVPEDHTYEFRYLSKEAYSDFVVLSGCTASTIGECGIYLMQPDGEFSILTQGYSEIYSPTSAPVSIHN